MHIKERKNMDILNRVWPKWSVEELIGQGTFGKVYKIKREELGKVSYAALKVIHLPQDEAEIRELLHSGMDHQSVQYYYEDMVKNLQNEIRVMEALKTGNNIVSIEDYEFLQDEDNIGWTILIRMELLENLNTYLERMNGEMPVKEIIKLGMDICKALECCERSHVIHRDIKPDNVFCNRYGDYKLGDFGISKQMEMSKSAYSQKGTGMYMAPEVYRGDHYGKTVDIYSLGIMLYRLLNYGRFPFMPSYPERIRPADSEEAMRKRVEGMRMDAPKRANEKLSAVIAKATAFKPEERFQTAAEMREQLDACLTQTGEEESVKAENKTGYNEDISEKLERTDLVWSRTSDKNPHTEPKNEEKQESTAEKPDMPKKEQNKVFERMMKSLIIVQLFVAVWISWVIPGCLSRADYYRYSGTRIAALVAVYIATVLIVFGSSKILSGFYEKRNTMVIYTGFVCMLAAIVINSFGEYFMGETVYFIGISEISPGTGAVYKFSTLILMWPLIYYIYLVGMAISIYRNVKRAEASPVEPAVLSFRKKLGGKRSYILIVLAVQILIEILMLSSYQGYNRCSILCVILNLISIILLVIILSDKPTKLNCRIVLSIVMAALFAMEVYGWRGNTASMYTAYQVTWYSIGFRFASRVASQITNYNNFVMLYRMGAAIMFWYAINAVLIWQRKRK